jgi:hypothetical protein
MRDRMKRVKEWLEWLIVIWKATPILWQVVVAIATSGAAVATWLSGYDHPQILILAAIGAFFLITTVIGGMRPTHLCPPGGRSFFVARFLAGAGEHSGEKFVADLRNDGTAERIASKIVPAATGTWKYVDCEARIQWSDGWTDILRWTPRGIIKIAFDKEGRSNRSTAVKIE